MNARLLASLHVRPAAPLETRLAKTINKEYLIGLAHDGKEVPKLRQPVQSYGHSKRSDRFDGNLK